MKRKAVCWLALVIIGTVGAGCASAPERAAFQELREVQRTADLASLPPHATSRGLPVLNENSTISDYLAYAALNNPGLKAAFHRWQAALEKVPQARSFPDPHVTYRYFIENVETRVGPQRQAFGLKQTLPFLGKRDLRGGVALQAANAAREKYALERVKLFHHVKLAYYDYYYLAREVRVLRESLSLLKYIEQVTRTRYKVGKVEQQAVIRAELELGKLDDRLRALNNLRAPIVARLNAALNRPQDAPIPWPKEIPHHDVNLPDDEILRQVKEANPSLKALAYEVRKRKNSVLLARREYYPDITLGLDYIDTASARMRGVRDSGKDPIAASVSINVPLWWGKYRAREREARARHRAAVKSKADAENSLQADTRMALYKLHDAERKTDLYRDTLIPKAKQAMKTLEAAFRAGTASFTDLIDAERILLEFQLSYEQARTARARSVAELEMLLGKDFPFSTSLPKRPGESAPMKTQGGDSEK